MAVVYTLQSTGNFDADCDNGSMKDYISRLTEMNCPNNDIENMVSTKVHQAYTDDCTQVSVINVGKNM